MGFSLVASNLACKYKVRVEMNRSGQHSSLLRYSNNYSHKHFIVQTKVSPVTLRHD